MTKTIVILQDGETYTGLDTCSICVISDEVEEQLSAGEITLAEMPVIAEIILREGTLTNALSL